MSEPELANWQQPARPKREPSKFDSMSQFLLDLQPDESISFHGEIQDTVRFIARKDDRVVDRHVFKPAIEQSRLDLLLFEMDRAMQLLRKQIETGLFEIEK